MSEKEPVIPGKTNSPKEIENVEVDITKYRSLRSPIAKGIWYAILSLIPISGILYVLGIHQRLGISLYAEQFIGLFLGLILSAVYISVPAGPKSPKDRAPWYDWGLAALGLYAGLYITLYYPDIVMKMGYVTTGRLIMSVMAVLLILEAIRRLLGKAMLFIVLAFLGYGFFAPYFPGIFRGSETSADQLFNYLYLDPNSLLNLLNIAATVALAFIFFGQILLLFGGADILNNFSISAFGRFRGGPAKGAIIGSSLVGTVTGGPVTNVMLTGTVTIPLMKKNGYKAEEAGAIESVASTGGQIMPPVMGIAAFIIAETLGVPYTDIALAALVPAIMFYVCLFFQVDFIAGRKGLKRLSKDQIPSMLKTIKSGWMIAPSLGALIYLLFFKGYTPQIAGIYAAVVSLVFLSFQKSVREKFFRLIPRIFIDTGKVMLEISVVLAAAGMVVGITGVTGLGFNLGMILASLADYGLLILLIVSAIVSVILGMGMPSVAAYTLVAVLVAPTLVELGVDPLAAHLFVFYFSIVSNFTPPVALACFAAAPIAKVSPHKIGFYAMRLGVIGYLVPFIFVYAPELLLRTQSPVPWSETVITIATAIFACYLLSMALESFLFAKLNAAKRIFLTVTAACLFLPVSFWQYSWAVNAAAFVAALVFIYVEWRNYRSSNSASPVEGLPRLSK